MSLRDDQLATLKAAGKDFDYYNIANLDGICLLYTSRCV